MNNLKKWATIVVAFLLVACSGPDAVRIRAERANLTLAQRCADGWFQALPWTPHDEQLVRAALADWDRALAADEALLAWPVAPAGGAK